MATATTPTRRRRPRDERLVPVVKTVISTNLRNGRRECWGARTVDGIWDFEREDYTGTNWLLRHVPSVADGSLTTPIHVDTRLDRARIFVGEGWAETTLAMLKCQHPADQRGARVERGTFDYFYEVCKTCGAFRPQHDDDDGCRTCDTYMAAEGPGHEWNAAVPTRAA